MRFLDVVRLRQTIAKLKRDFALEKKDIINEYDGRIEKLKSTAVRLAKSNDEDTQHMLEQHEAEITKVRETENKRLSNVVSERDMEIARLLEHIRENAVIYSDLNDRNYKTEEVLSRTLANMISGDMQIRNGIKVVQGSLDEIESMNRKRRKVEHTEQKAISEK